MDIRKILSKINLIIEFENQNNIHRLVKDIFNYLQNGNTNSLKNTKENLFSILDASEINNFTNSDLKILDFLSIKKFFSIELKNEIDNILSLNSYEVNNEFQNFINGRNKNLDKIKRFKSYAEQLQIKPEAKNENYQLVFSFPDKYNQLDKLQEVTKNINHFLNELNSHNGNKENFKISSVNNGCIEFFIDCGQFLVEHTITIIDHILRIAGAIELFKKSKETYKNYSKDRKQTMEKLAKEQLEEDKKDILEVDMINELKIKNEEAKSRIIKHTKIIVKHFEAGMNIEAKIPLLEKPAEIDENDDEETKQQKHQKLKQYNERQKIIEMNKNILKISNERINLELTDGKEKNEQP